MENRKENLGYTMEQVIQMVGTVANSNVLVLNRMDNVESIVGALAKKSEESNIKIRDIEDEIDRLKLQEEITDEQREQITSKSKARMCEVLYFNESDINKYGRVYISNLYTFLKQKHNLGGKIATTKKGNYDNVMNGIQSWYPDHEKLKSRVDNRIGRAHV